MVNDYTGIERCEIGGAAISKEDYIFLVNFAKSENIKTVLEFGPGASTFAFLDAGCHVASLEYSDSWINYASNEFRNYDVTLVKYNNVANINIPELTIRKFDMAFVDSPPMLTFKQPISRLNTCVCAAKYTDLILLHDSNRLEEQNTIKLFELNGFSIIGMCNSNAGIAIIKRTG